MVATRASRKRVPLDDSRTMTSASAAAATQEVIDLTESDDEVGVEVAPPRAKRHRKNADDASKNRSNRALQPVNDNTRRKNGATSTAAKAESTRPTRTTRSQKNASTSKPAAVAARVVSENPSTKRAQVTRKEASTTTSNATRTANNKKRIAVASSRPSNPYSFRTKRGVPIKTPATTESITNSDNNGISPLEPNRSVSNGDADIAAAAMSSKKAIGGGKDEGSSSSSKSYQYNGSVEDIDARDRDNPQNVTDYVQDIYDHYRQREEDTTITTPLSAESQPYITERMRAILVDWILEVHYKFKLTQQTLYLAVSVLDRFLHESAEPVTRRELQLVGITSLLVAAKYEELFVPELRDLAYICDGAYTEQQILDTEERILKDIEYNLTVPTAHSFLIRFLKAAHADKNIVQISSMILDSTLISFEGLTCSYLPSQLAAGAIWIARRTVGRNSWSPTLLKYSEYCEEDIKPVARAILRAKDRIHADLVGLQKKYSKTKYGKVSEVKLASMDNDGDDESYEE